MAKYKGKPKPCAECERWVSADTIRHGAAVQKGSKVTHKGCDKERDNDKE